MISILDFGAGNTNSVIRMVDALEGSCPRHDG